jgi:hypothetical protein
VDCRFHLSGSKGVGLNLPNDLPDGAARATAGRGGGVVRALGLLGVLCAAGAAPGSPTYLDAHYRVLSAPDCVDARNMVREFDPAPANATYMRVQHVGDPGTPELAGEVANVVTWDVGQLSGFSVPPVSHASAQRGWRDLGPPDPASAFQLWCNGAGFVLNSRQFAHAAPLVLEGPSVSVAREPDPPAAVFGNATSALTLEASIGVPWVQAEAAPVIDGTAQVSFVYYARDTTTGTLFAHVIALFDNRASGVNGAGTEAVSADAYTAFVVSPLRARTADGAAAQFVTRSPLSAEEQFVTGWTQPRYFRAHVTYAQFRALLATLRQSSLPSISPRPEDYRVTLFGVLGEIFPGTTPDHEVGLAAGVTDLKLAEAYYDLSPSPVIEYYHAALGHYFMTSRADEIAALDAGTLTGWTRTGARFAAYPAYASGTVPVCRYYLPPAFGDSHFFSASTAECADVARRFPQFVSEDPEVMYVALPDPTSGACPAGTLAVYRLWNARVDTNHRYTADPATRATMLARGWVAEGYGPLGVAMCAPGP